MTNPQQTFSIGDLWSNSPPAFKGGVVVAIIASLVSVSSAEMTTVNGEVTSCSYFDIIKVVGAVLLVGLAVAGLIANKKSRRPLPTWIAAVIAGVLVVVAVLLVIQGLGVAMSPCQP